MIFTFIFALCNTKISKIIQFVEFLSYFFVPAESPQGLCGMNCMYQIAFPCGSKFPEGRL
ncbi:hypothetical protein EGI31_08905 [Lacihabitans soyangensis]|uniref:Uncharacterized protein n=1 Tax=Lacihabitans soyangensis TaxID=869394 RepID=A0AAE3KSG2_9BACT|nr:hypothetical protein [Lacihabitans soyangensis]